MKFCCLDEVNVSRLFSMYFIHFRPICWRRFFHRAVRKDKQAAFLPSHLAALVLYRDGQRPGDGGRVESGNVCLKQRIRTLTTNTATDGRRRKWISAATAGVHSLLPYLCWYFLRIPRNILRQRKKTKTKNYAVMPLPSISWRLLYSVLDAGNDLLALYKTSERQRRTLLLVATLCTFGRGKKFMNASACVSNCIRMYQMSACRRPVHGADLPTSINAVLLQNTFCHARISGRMNKRWTVERNICSLNSLCSLSRRNYFVDWLGWNLWLVQKWSKAANKCRRGKL